MANIARIVALQGPRNLIIQRSSVMVSGKLSFPIFKMFLIIFLSFLFKRLVAHWPQQLPKRTLILLQNSSELELQQLVLLVPEQVSSFLIFKYTIHLQIVIFYTEILKRKVVLWSFFTSETSEESHNSTFWIKISV